MSLSRSTPLRRTGAPKRRTRLRPVGRKAQREAPALTAFRDAVHGRERCEVETPACPHGWHTGTHAHHLWPSDRDRGCHDPERGLLVCAPGHAYIHANPAWSRERGWLMQSGDER